MRSTSHAVTKPDRRAGSVCNKLSHHVPGDLPFVLEQRRFSSVTFWKASPFAELTCSIHRLRSPERELMPVLPEALHRLAFFRGAVAVPPGSENVKILQSESRGIDLGVADRRTT